MRCRPGPVFRVESLIGARRWQVYAARSAVVAILFVGLFLVWQSADLQAESSHRPLTYKEMAEVGLQFYCTLAGLQLTLVLLAAPAATASSICLDRARGTLVHMLVTDLSALEIVGGTLGARLLPVVGLVACGFPVLAIATLLGGVDPVHVGGALLVSVAVTLLGCSLAILVSTVARKPLEVLMAIYAAWTVWLLSHPLWSIGASIGRIGPPPSWIRLTNPFVLVLAPYLNSGSVDARDVAGFFLGALLLSLVFASLAAARLRPALLNQEETGRRERRRLVLDPWKAFARSRWALPALERNPVLWREWHRNRPTRLTRTIWLGLAVASITATAWAIYEERSGSMTGRFLSVVVPFQVAIGLLMVTVTSPSALVEERARGSLELLMATPLPTRTIVMGKFWGAYRAVPLIAALPTLGAAAAAAMATDGPSGMMPPQTRSPGRIGWRRRCSWAPWSSRPARCSPASASRWPPGSAARGGRPRSIPRSTPP